MPFYITFFNIGHKFSFDDLLGKTKWKCKDNFKLLSDDVSICLMF